MCLNNCYTHGVRSVNTRFDERGRWLCPLYAMTEYSETA